METKDGLSAAVLEVLDRDNYVAWSARVKTYLMVQDLWEVVEATTESPKQEDDEAAFKAWSDKNSTALHVIHVSCGPHALSVIRQISSAKIAWNTLAVVLQVLEKDNYLDWSVRVKTYLIAHDLWDIIEGITEPPKQQDDEASFEAWSKKNSMALHVIQMLCGPDTLSEIIDISSAKIAWDTLVKKFLQVLEEDTYEEWSVRVKTYLIAHDLWDIIEGTTEPPKQQDDGASFKAWSKKNSMALHVIQMLCGPDTLSEIIDISSAKIAWDTLVKKFLQVLEEDAYEEWSVRVKTYLIAHDLWDIIEGITEPPKQQDDEASFEAWSKKNSMALHVIQMLCGPDTLSEIIDISSAKIAWDTLVKKFLQVLEEDTYEEWSVRVKTYLIAHDLWDIIEGTTEPPKQQDDGASFKAWSKKNSMALHVIQMLCGPDTLSEIIDISSAKIAWDTLVKKFLQVLEEDAYEEWSVRVKTYLIAHDLWDIIEGITEPPKQQDDEASFEAWSKKNSMALHVIQMLCGPDTLSEIIDISSAKIAWDTLVKKFLQVLEEDTYEEWSVRVKTYLIAHDLWDIIEGTTEPPKQQDDGASFKAWSKKNSMALHVIQMLCGPDTLSEIIDISSAKIAWDTLVKKFLQVLEEDAYEEWSVRVKTYLIAHDLWDIIEGITEPPKQQDDEASFEAWSKKNSMALHVIQMLCGPDTLSEIIDISSAKIAWDTLVKKFLQVLEEDTYEEWSVRVKTYLIAHDLWDIIEGTTEPPKQQDDGASFKAWSKKNSMALHVIQMLCGPDTLSEIIDISSAKIAWDTLVKKGSNLNHYLDQYWVLNKAVRNGDWNTAEYFLNSNATSAQITSLGETALHVAVEAGHEDIVEKLVNAMSVEDLAIQDCYGMTALVGAINAGNYRMAECMLRKNYNLLSIKNSNEQIPLIQAISNGYIELARYLYSLTPLEDLRPEQGVNGATLCTQAIYTRSLDIALDLLGKLPRLALALDYQGLSPFYALAAMPYAFPSVDRLVIWKRWIYSGIHIQPGRSALEEIRLNIPNAENCRCDLVIKIIGLVKSLLRRLVSYLLLDVLGMKHLYEMKSVHVQSRELLSHMWKVISISNSEQRIKGYVYSAIVVAIKKGNIEFVFDAVRENPDLLRGTDERRTIFEAAVKYRQPQIFSFIYERDENGAFTYSVDEKGNHILHIAGIPADSTILNRIQGPALQMQKELQWFKEVEKIVHPKFKEAFNNEFLTPRELFTKEHEDLRKAGEQWMRSTTTSCTVVAALIVTIMFAAAFTVPGGNDQTSGFPIFLHKKLFMLFIVSDALSLFSSSTSVMMFLSILTSRYAEDDFLESLPRRTIIGLSTLFFSITTMMIAFSAALLIMLHGQLGIVIPIVCLASLPVTLFVLMHFSLLVEMFISTYRPGIFNKKMERRV